MTNLEKVRGGYLVDVPKEREESFRRAFPTAKQKGDRWRVSAADKSAAELWTAETETKPDDLPGVETGPISAIDSELEKVGPDMVRRRILMRQRENRVAEGARR